MLIVTAAIAALGIGGWWTLRSDLPSDWAGRDSFCAEAKSFALTNQAVMSVSDRVTALTAMIASSPQELRPDLRRLLDSMSGATAGQDSPQAIAESGRTAGEFIERVCGVNLPNVRT